MKILRLKALQTLTHHHKKTHTCNQMPQDTYGQTHTTAKQTINVYTIVTAHCKPATDTHTRKLSRHMDSSFYPTGYLDWELFAYSTRGISIFIIAYKHITCKGKGILAHIPLDSTRLNIQKPYKISCCAQNKNIYKQVTGFWIPSELHF